MATTAKQHGEQKGTGEWLDADVQSALEQAEETAQQWLGFNFAFGIGSIPLALIDSLRRFARLLAVNPRIVAKKEAQMLAELGRITMGRSHIKPPPYDLRFKHPIWEQSGYYRRVLQTYLVWRKALFDILASADADEQDKRRARFILMQITEALAPTNTPIGNPGFVDQLIKTKGLSVLRGARNFAYDMAFNRGMPRQVDTDAFVVGEDLAATPGAVVFRNEICEIIQYQPSTKKVHARPALLVPPQINKYYIADLAPDKSFMKYAVDQGLQMFTISWRNPTKRQAHWNVDTYAAAILEAIDVVREISGQDSIDVIGACAGGMTLIGAAAYLAENGEVDRIHNLTLLVTAVDMNVPMLLSLFASPSTMRAAKAYVQRRGVIDGAEMARVFSWLRPTDLVWLFFANNYLMGSDPPAFDFLYWNCDSTRLPAGFHCDAIDMFQANVFMRPGKLEVLGRTVDPGKIDRDSFIVAGIKDHIVPWRACYAATQILGGTKRFVLGSSGHIQAVVSPPGKKNARYYVNEDYVPDPDEWLHHAGMREGSWWEYWREWLVGDAEPAAPAPRTLGSERHPPLDPAPGRYVFT